MSTFGTWKCTIGGASFADYTDCFEPEGEVPAQKNIMEVAGYGAAAMVFIDLGNLRMPRHFSLTREHATDKAAEDWRQTGAAAFAGVATVVLTHKNLDASETTYTITGANVEIIIAQRVGATTTTKVIITGGIAT